jgi:hypothetical protein
MKFVDGSGLGLLLKDLKTRFDGKLDKAAVGAANGVASLDADGKVPVSQLPDFYTKPEIDDKLKKLAQLIGTGSGGDDITNVVNNAIWHPGAQTGGIRWDDPEFTEIDGITIQDTVSDVPVFVTTVEPGIGFWGPQEGLHKYMLQAKKTSGGYTSGLVLEETEYSTVYEANLLSAIIPAAMPNHVVLSFDNLVKLNNAAGFGVTGIADDLVFVDQLDQKTVRLRLANKYFIRDIAYTLSYNAATGNVMQNNDVPIEAIVETSIENRSGYSPAVLVSAQVPQAEPATLVAVMSRSIHVSDINSFSLSGTSAVITGVVSEGVTVEFSLDEPVDADETSITLAYNGNGAVDDHGQQVAAFTGSVENNSMNTPITVHSASIPADDPKKLYVVMEGAVTMESAAGFLLASPDQTNLPDLSACAYMVSDGTIIFTLYMSLLAGKSFIVTYNGNGSLRDVSNNDAIKAFSQIVVNNSTDDEEILSYLTFSSPSAFSIGFLSKNWDGTIKYSTDGFSWNTWDGAYINAALSKDLYKLCICGIDNTIINSNLRSANANSDIWCDGNIETLLDYAKVAEGLHPTMGSGCFKSLFGGFKKLANSPVLPAITLADSCYSNMFANSDLFFAPELPATTLASNCYYNMFKECTGLYSAPALPATTLADSCYERMFIGCTRLIAAPALPATTLAKNCYNRICEGCTNIRSVTNLRATKLFDNCYIRMFHSCPNIKVSATQTSPYLIAWRIPTSGTAGANSSCTGNMLANTGGTFKGDPQINTTYYVENYPVG